MNKDCNIVRDLLPLYADNQASEESADFITEHCFECDECRKLLDLALYPVESEVDDTDEAAKMLMESIAQGKGKKKQKKRKITKKAVVIGITTAILLIILCFGFVFRGNAWFTTVNLAQAENYDTLEEWSLKSVVYDHAAKDEIEQAAAEVRRFFESKFAGAILLNLTYSEEYSNENRIVFESRCFFLFDTDGIIPPFSEFDYLNFTLEKNAAYDKWIVTNYGQG